MAFKQLSEVGIPDPFIILAGDSGDGKTALATTLGEGAILYAYETGYTTALTLKDKFYNDRTKVRLGGVYIDDGPFNPATCAWMRSINDLESISAYMKTADAKPFTSFIFDGLSSAYEACVRYVLGGVMRQPEYRDWSIIQSQILYFIGKIRALPGVKILIAHLQRDRYTHDIETGLPYANPVQFQELAIAGTNLPNKICLMANDVWQLKTVKVNGKEDRVIRTVASPLLKLKTQFQIKNNQSVLELGMPGLLSSCGYDYSSKQAKFISSMK